MWIIVALWFVMTTFGVSGLLMITLRMVVDSAVNPILFIVFGMPIIFAFVIQCIIAGCYDTWCPLSLVLPPPKD